ncbi:MAG TPA: dihydrofolate reductase family protein [Streptosporangiaceae bacterium]
MRKLIARVFDYSLDGFVADEGTEYFEFCRDLPDDDAQLDRTADLYERAYAHIMGRAVYEGMASYFPAAADHPYASALNSARKIVFSRTLKTADWASTTIAAGDTAEEIDRLRRGGDGHIIVSGGVSFWQSLLRLDLIDELRVTVFPYLAGEGTRLFADPGKPRQLHRVSSIAWSNGTVELEYRRDR